MKVLWDVCGSSVKKFSCPEITGLWSFGSKCQHEYLTDYKKVMCPMLDFQTERIHISK